MALATKNQLLSPWKRKRSGNSQNTGRSGRSGSKFGTQATSVWAGKGGVNWEGTGFARLDGNLDNGAQVP